MTSGQKKNIDRLKKLHVEAKKIKKQHPSYTYADCLKLASGHAIKPKKIASTLLLERRDLLLPHHKPSKKLLTLRDKKGKFKGYKEIAGTNKQTTYKGFVITKLYPSGYYEFYSDKQGTFLKFSTLTDAKKQITKEKGKISSVSEKKILTASHKVKAAANKLDELQHEHMLQKSIGKMAESFLAVYSSNGKTIIQRFKTTSLMEAKKLASAFKKMHKLKGTLKVSKFSHI